MTMFILIPSKSSYNQKERDVISRTKITYVGKACSRTLISDPYSFLQNCCKLQKCWRKKKEMLNVFLWVAEIQVPAPFKTSYLTEVDPKCFEIYVRNTFYLVVSTHFWNLTNHGRKDICSFLKAGKCFQLPMKNAVLLENYSFSMSLLPHKFPFTFQ